jgi:glycosyltransferase involved in cell wall biosynthesis
MPHLNVGGVEKNLFILSNFLVTKIKNVSIITVNKEIKKKLDKRIKIISIPTKKFNNSHIYTKYLICICLLIKTILFSKNNLILTFQGNWYAILVAKIFRIKILTRSNTAPNGWSKNKVKNFLYKLILNMSDEIIVNSDEFKKIIKNKFNLNSVTIYNPLNKNEIIRLSKKKINFNYFNDNQSLKIINFSRLTDQKNHILLLKGLLALKKKISFKLLIAGDGPEKNNIKNFIIKNKLIKNVKLMNYLENPYPYLKLSDILILTSNYEGLPNVLLEAQTLKKTIISSDCPSGPKEILKNGKYGYLFKTGNAKDLSEKVYQAYRNKKLNKKIVKYGYQNLFRFEKQKNLNKYYDLLSKYL